MHVHCHLTVKETSLLFTAEQGYTNKGNMCYTYTNTIYTHTHTIIYAFMHIYTRMYMHVIYNTHK